MASTSKYGGPSLTPDELADPSPPLRKWLTRAEIGYVDRKEEPQSVTTDGGGSIQSSKNEAQSSDKPKASRRKPAQTMANPSSQTVQENSDAPLTDGVIPTTETAFDEFDEFN